MTLDHVEVSAIFNTEMGCERRCTVELCLDDAQPRFTLDQMLSCAHAAHNEAHQHQIKVFRWTNDVTVRAYVQIWKTA